MYKRWAELDRFKELNKKMRTPLVISGIVLELVKDYFTNNSEQFKYSANPLQSNLIIEMSQQWNPANCNNYPGLYIMRNGWQLYQEGKVIGNYKELLIPKDGSSYEFWAPVTATYGILGVAKEYGELEKLMDELFSFLLVFENPIRTFFNFIKFNVMQLGPTNLVKTDKEYRTCELGLIISFDLVWRLTKEQGLIKHVKIRDAD